MLNLPANAATLLDASGPITPIYCLAVDFPSAPLMVFDRDVVYGGITHTARLEAVEAARLEGASGPFGGVPRFTLRARLLNAVAPPADPARPSDRLLAADLGSLRFRLLVGFLAAGTAPTSPATLTDDDLVQVASLRATTITERDGRVELDLEDEIHAAGSVRKPCPLFQPFAASSHPFRVAGRRRVAWVFGAAEGVRLEPWRFGPIVRLTADLQPGSGVAQVSSTTRLPKQGNVQIGDELLSYTRVGSSPATIGSAGQPLDRPDPQYHPAGEEVYVIPTGGFGWIAAAHPCANVGTPRTDSADVAPDSWSVEEVELDPGRPATTIVLMPKLPTRTVREASTAQVRIDEAIGAQWQPGSYNSALTPEHALDYDNDSTAARLNFVQSRLEFEMAPLGLGDANLGNAVRASIILRLASTPSWGEDSTVWVGATNGDVAISRIVERKAGAIVDGIPANVSLRTWAIDVTSDIAALNAMLLSGHRLYLVFGGAQSDGAIIQVTALYWRIEVDRPELVRPETELRADIEGWMGTGGSALLSTPARLLGAMITDEHALNLGADAIDATAIDELHTQQQLAARRVSRVVRGTSTWLELIDDLLAQTGMELRPRGSDWLPLATGWPSDMITPVEDIPATERYAGGSDAAQDLSTSAKAPPRRIVAYYGREDDDAVRWSRGAVAMINDAPGDDESTEAHWLPEDQSSYASALAIRMLDQLGSAARELSVEVPWSVLAHAWGGDSLRFAGGVGEAFRAIGAPMPAGAAAGRITGVSLLSDRSGLRLTLRDRLGGTLLWEDGPMQLIAFARRGFAFVADGAIVAFLRRDGELFLRGLQLSDASFPATAESLHYDAVGERMILSVSWFDTWLPVAAITATGDLQTPYTVHEHLRTLASQQFFMVTSEGELRLGNISGNTLLRVTGPSFSTTIRGGIVERAPFAEHI